VIVAHRGASASEAENTLEAFEAAVAAGADAVEFDVRMTADGVPVVLHDADVARTTDGGGLVRDLSLNDVKRLRIRTPTGSPAEIPTLRETLVLLSGRAAVDVEIKNVPGDRDFDADREVAVEATIETLEASSFSGPVLVSSFNPFSLVRVRELAPEIPTGLLTGYDVEAHAALEFAHAQGHPWVLPFAEMVRPDAAAVVRAAHRAGVHVGTWIVDDADVASELIRAEVDAIATNDPAALVAVRAEVTGP
jgi:glycerophosphoryl diester phosphodiesterase